MVEKRKESEDIDGKDELCKGIAFAQLTQYIEDCCQKKDTPIFKLSDITRLYVNSLSSQGVIMNNRIHSTRLKQKLLDFFPDLHNYLEGRETMLVFSQHVGKVLKDFKEKDYDEEGQTLFKAAKIIRRDIFNMKSDNRGSFDDGCQKESIPQSLLSLLEMILDGTNLKSTSHITKSQSSLSLSQLVVFNSTKKRKETPLIPRHSKERETPLPLYIGLYLHAKTRKRELVDMLHDLGISVSYDRVLELSTDLANKACIQYEHDEVVCPQPLKSGLFTTSAIDNIDHNPSSTTAKDSFHGTDISMFQHPSDDIPGVQRVPVSSEDYPKQKSKSVRELPEFYRNIPPNVFRKGDLIYPGQVVEKPEGMKLEDLKSLEIRWLEHVDQRIIRNSDEPLDVTCAAYYGNSNNNEVTQSISALLPLFSAQAESVSMLKHGMSMIEKATSFLHPDQVSVVTADQPLFALMKQIQWHYPLTHGEDKFVILLGGLHIEMAFLKLLGSWLRDSGWTDMLVSANIATPGRADSFLRASHVRRTRRAHEVTVCVLYHLMLQAYESLLPSVSFDEWCKISAQKYPTFKYWWITFNLEVLLVSFVKSERSADFNLYVELLEAISPWMFALDHTNYARWMTVHIHDLKALKTTHPTIEAEFMKGNFVVHKTKNVFSGLPIDQAHEQNNAKIKGEGGAIGLTENEAALRRWTVGGPEVARLLEEFQTSMESVGTFHEENCHHEQKNATQTNFLHDVQALSEVIDEYGNPFLDSSSELVVITTKDVVDDSVLRTLQVVEKVGRDQYEAFVTERLVNNLPLSATLKKKTASDIIS